MGYEVYLGEAYDGFHFVLSENGNACIFNLACQFERQEPFGCMDVRGVQPIDVLSILECEKSIDIAIIQNGVMHRFDTTKTRLELLESIRQNFGAKLILNRKGVSHSKAFVQNIVTFAKGTLNMEGVKSIL